MSQSCCHFSFCVGYLLAVRFRPRNRWWVAILIILARTMALCCRKYHVNLHRSSAIFMFIVTSDKQWCDKQWICFGRYPTVPYALSLNPKPCGPDREQASIQRWMARDDREAQAEVCQSYRRRLELCRGPRRGIARSSSEEAWQDPAGDCRNDQHPLGVPSCLIML